MYHLLRKATLLALASPAAVVALAQSVDDVAVYRAIALDAMEAEPNTFNLREGVPAYQFGNGLSGDDFWPFPGWRAHNGETAGFDTYMTVEPRDSLPGAGEVHFHDGTARDVSTEPDLSMPGDRYFLGDHASRFYVGRVGTQLDGDFAYIEHFDVDASEVYLFGAPEDYVLVGVEEPYAGTAMFYRKGGVGAEDDDLMAVFLAVDPESIPLDAGNFRYATPPSPSTVSDSGIAQAQSASVDVWPAVDVDETGDVYLAYRTPDELPENANPDCGCDLAVIKYSPEGQVLWQGNYGDGAWGRSGRFSRIYDAQYLDGFFYLPVFIGNAVGSGGGAFQAIKIDAATGEQVGIFAYKPAPGVNNVTGIVADDTGHVYLSGSYSGSVNQGPGPYFLKVDASDITSGDTGLDTFVDGGFENTFFHEGHGGLAFHPDATQPGGGLIANAGWNNMVAVGNHHAMWLRVYTAAGDLLGYTQLTDGRDEPGWAWQVEFDSRGDIYVTGVIHGDVAAVPSTTYNRYADIALFKVDGTTFELLDATVIGSPWSDEPIDMVIDARDRIYLTGHTYGSLFAANSGAGAYADGFVAKFDTDLQLLEGVQLGTEREDHFTSLQVRNGYVYVAGFTEGSLFAPIDATTYNTDAVVMRLSAADLTFAPDAPLSRLREREGDPVVELEVYPNPANSVVTVSLPPLTQDHGAAVELRDVRGRVVRRAAAEPSGAGRTEVSLPVNGLAPGVYTCRVSSGRSQFARSVVVVP